MPRKKQELEQQIDDQTQTPDDEVMMEEPVDQEAIKSALMANNPEEESPETADQEGEEEKETVDDELEDRAGRLMRAKRRLEMTKDSRRKYDKEWLSRDLFRRGYQFVSNQRGSVTMTSRNNSQIPVNLTWAFSRSIKNQVTSFNPKFEVLPEYKGKKAESDARLAGKLLDSVFKANNLNKQIKEAVIQGLFFSVGGPFEVFWDENFDNGKGNPRGEVRVRLHDPFDVYFDPDATDIEDCQFIIKAVRTDIDKIRNNPKYEDALKARVKTGSMKRAESEYKQFLLQTIQNSQIQTEDNDSTILYEMHEKITDKDGDVKVRISVWVNEVEDFLSEEVIDQEYYDMEIFQADMNPLEMYGESWSKHIIALNKVINALESSIFDYHYKFAKGRLVIDKNSGVREIVNEHGSIIEKNRGAQVTALPIASLPNSYETQLGRFNARIEDIAGVHDASLGRAPASVKSGIGIAELKQSDSSNQDDLVQNLEQCLMRLGTKILKKVATNYTIPRIKKVVGNGQLVEHFAVVGNDFVSKDKEKWTVGGEKYPLAHVAYNNELSVSIGSWLAYTKEGRQKVLMDLATAGIIDKETVLKYYEFPDVKDIIDNTRIESLIEQKRKEEPTMPMGISQEQLAMAENEMLLEGTPAIVDPEQDNHELHIAIHSKVMDNGESDPVIMAHIREHQRALKGGGQPVNKQPIPGQEQPQDQGGPQLSPGMPPQGPPPQIPMPGQASMPQPLMAAPQIPMPPRPDISYLSAGVQELPQTATSIMGGPGNAMPV